MGFTYMNQKSRSYLIALCVMITALSCMSFILAGISAQFAIFGYREFLESLGRPPLDLPSAFAECALYGDHPSIPVHVSVWACCLLVCNHIIVYRVFAGRHIVYFISFIVSHLAVCSLFAALSFAGVSILVVERHGKMVQEESPYRGSMAEISVCITALLIVLTAFISVYCVVFKGRRGFRKAV